MLEYLVWLYSVPVASHVSFTSVLSSTPSHVCVPPTFLTAVLYWHLFTAIRQCTFIISSYHYLSYLFFAVYITNVSLNLTTVLYTTYVQVCLQTVQAPNNLTVHHQDFFTYHRASNLFAPIGWIPAGCRYKIGYCVERSMIVFEHMSLTMCELSDKVISLSHGTSWFRGQQQTGTHKPHNEESTKRELLEGFWIELNPPLLSHRLSKYFA